MYFFLKIHIFPSDFQAIEDINLDLILIKMGFQIVAK